MKLQGNMKVIDNNLHIGRYSMEYLREKYETPLYIMDEDDFRSRIGIFKESFQSEAFKTEILYASKALSNIYILKILDEMGISLDVVSGGEIYTAKRAGFNPDKIYFHGNNKLHKELVLALDYGIGTIVIDNEDEVNLLEELLEEKGKRQKVMVRVNPGIEAHTHEYIKTTKNDSKFGISIFDKETYRIIKRISESENFDLIGFHAHIGSQVFQQDSFFDEARTMLKFTKDVEEELGIRLTAINLGGGFGVYYTEEDQPFEYGDFLKNYIGEIEKYIDELGLSINNVMIEPGRSLVSTSGSTLYTINSIKKTYGGKNYLFIDGGMTDNIRPALYGAKYEGCITNKVEDHKTEIYTVAGKCCESGDIVIRDIRLPKADKNDMLLVSSTGAYNFSMSSNYNRVERPAMVFLSGEKEVLAVKRQSYEDLVQGDVE